ncbi:hypothetical protein [Halorussus salinisoli]|uniref:hypothetical protein n=1 Tax=Halorussus salinisoli TaxID=2558242 RepID=UPI0010C195B2|nr:hypothetical protein [Halorussus salinisoli]
MSTASPEVARSLILNGLRDVVYDTDLTVESDSRRELESAFYEGTESVDRGNFVTALSELEEAAPEDTLDQDTHRTLQEVVDDVLAQLQDSNTHLSVTHETGVELPEQDVALYNFAHSRDYESVASLAFSDSVADEVHHGAEHATNNAFERATDAFERAVDMSETTEEVVATRVLAAWAAHWSGDDERALDYAEEAKHFKMSSWSIEMVRSAASDASSDAFRRGSLEIAAYLRARVSIPENANLRVRVGRGEINSTEWGTWSREFECLPVKPLDSHVRVQFELTGPVQFLPVLHTYYCALGTIEPRSAVPRTTDTILFDGPVTADASELLELDLPDS